MKPSLLTIFIVTALGFSVAQASENQLWTSVAVKGSINEEGKLLFWFDGHARSRNDVDSLGVTIFRPGLGWRMSDKLDLWTGYAKVIARRNNASSVKEERFWQQATYSIGRFASGKISARTRLEQRFRDVGGSDTGWRLRQSIGYSKPFSSNPKVSFVLSNEIFIGLNDANWGQRDGYDQNRTFIGFTIKNTSKITTSIGYLNNHLDRGAAGNQTNHNLSAGISIKL